MKLVPFLTALSFAIFAGMAAVAQTELPAQIDTGAEGFLELEAVLDRLDMPGAGDRPTLAACCKICTTGKACGNSCISRDKRCRKGVGCACDG